MMAGASILLFLFLLAPILAQAQEADQTHRIGVLLYDGAPPGLLEAFREGLQDLVYVEGKNITGLSVMHTELSAKRLELLRQLLPGISRVVILSNADNAGHTPQVAEMELASSQLGLEFLSLPVRGASDLPGAFEAATRARAKALVVLDDTSCTNHRAQILKLAADHSLPVVSRYKDFADAGALIAYGPNLPALYRRAAYYTDKILKGAKPSDLPIEQPTRFDLVVNLKTAKSLGLTIPPSVLISADHVIE